MGAVTVYREKQKWGTEEKTKSIWSRIASLFKKISEWDLIDGDAFLESKDWPYLWKK